MPWVRNGTSMEYKCRRNGIWTEQPGKPFYDLSITLDSWFWIYPISATWLSVDASLPTILTTGTLTILLQCYQTISSSGTWCLHTFRRCLSYRLETLPVILGPERSKANENSRFYYLSKNNEPQNQSRLVSQQLGRDTLAVCSL
jgi:hypothetical protein